MIGGPEQSSPPEHPFRPTCATELLCRGAVVIIEQAAVVIRKKEGLCLLFIHPRAPNLIGLRSAGTMPA